jgi:hypothetical protein
VAIWYICGNLVFFPFGYVVPSNIWQLWHLIAFLGRSFVFMSLWYHIKFERLFYKRIRSPWRSPNKGLKSEILAPKLSSLILTWRNFFTLTNIHRRRKVFRQNKQAKPNPVKFDGRIATQVNFLGNVLFFSKKQNDNAYHVLTTAQQCV